MSQSKIKNCNVGRKATNKDTVCQCGHWYEEHTTRGGACFAPTCEEIGCCSKFTYDPNQNTIQDIADRGGDPDKWPKWMKQAIKEE